MVVNGVAPSRERGLKQYSQRAQSKWMQVAPSRERGLKRFYPQHPFHHKERRSFAGAWIETVKKEEEKLPDIVAPSRERGLKHDTLVI